MELKSHPNVEVSEGLLDALRSFPLLRDVEHCGVRFTVAPFDSYANCPQCGTRLKVRSFSGAGEIEDVFDAVLEWLDRPAARAVAERRQAELREEE